MTQQLRHMHSTSPCAGEVRVLQEMTDQKYVADLTRSADLTHLLGKHWQDLLVCLQAIEASYPGTGLSCANGTTGGAHGADMNKHGNFLEQKFEQ